MSNFVLMSSIIATYTSQNGQTFRCSDNFPHWDTTKQNKLKLQVIVPDGYPQPTFSLTHDKAGQDKTWYKNLKDGVEIDVTSGEGGHGKFKIYAGTTSKLPDGLNGTQTYAILVWVSA